MGMRFQVVTPAGEIAYRMQLMGVETAIDCLSDGQF